MKRSNMTANCNNTRFLHVDHQGSMIATDDCSGNRATVATYDEYGIPGASNWGRFQYTGQAYIPEIGMYYYKARIYSPTLGRFLQTDPVGYADGPNGYEYAHGDPVNLVDPTGLGPPPTPDPCDPPTPACSIIVTAKRLPRITDPCIEDPAFCTDPFTIFDLNLLGGASGDFGIGAFGGTAADGGGKEKQKPTKEQCAVVALKKNALGLGLDAAGVAADVFFGPELGAVAALGLGAAALGNSIAHRDFAGGTIALVGRESGVGVGLLSGRAASVAHGISRVALGLSIINDSAQAFQDYESCLNGK